MAQKNHKSPHLPYTFGLSMAQWMLIDMGIIVASYISTYYLRITVTVEMLRQGAWFIAFAVALNILGMLAGRVYQRRWNQTSGNAVVTILWAFFQTAVILLPINYFFEERPVPMSVIIAGQFLAMVMVVATRYRSRIIRRFNVQLNYGLQGSQELTKTRVLLVGAGRSGELYAYHSEKFKRQQTIIGFVDDDPKKQSVLIEDKPVLGQIADIPTVVLLYEIEQIVVTLHNVSGARMRQIYEICRGANLPIKMMPDLMNSAQSMPESIALRDIQIEDLVGRKSVQGQLVMDYTPIAGKRIMITGAAGSVGSELCRQLVRVQPAELILLDNNESGIFDLHLELKNLFSDLTIKTVLCDVADEVALSHVYQQLRPQVVFHAAAYKHVPMLEDHPYQAVRTNLQGTYQAARLAQRFDVERFVLISTDKAVNLKNVMGSTKYLCEQIIRTLQKTYPEATTQMAAVRFGNVLGSRGSVVPIFKRQIEQRQPITITDKRMTRYFMSIPEAALLVIQAGCLTTEGDVFVLEMGESIRIVDLAEHLIRLHHLRPYIDVPIVFTGMRPGETLHEKLTADGEVRQPTTHPHIATYVQPPLNTERFLERLTQFVDDYPTLTETELRATVLDLAQAVRHNFVTETHPIPLVD